MIHSHNNKNHMRYLSKISIGLSTPNADFILCNKKNIDSIIRLPNMRRSE